MQSSKFEFVINLNTARAFGLDAFVAVFALVRRVSVPAEKQAADLTPQLAVSP
jgi:hypothetical protein